MMEVKMSTKFLRKAAVAARYSINPRTVERMISDGRLPKPVYRGRFPLWKESDLDESDRRFAVASRPKTAA
jgi:predicted DNA-binding transcriptional regulator AlpA